MSEEKGENDEESDSPSLAVKDKKEEAGYDEENGKKHPVSTTDGNNVTKNNAHHEIEVKAGLWSRFVSFSTTKSYRIGMAVLICILLILIVIMCVYIARDGFGDEDKDDVTDEDGIIQNNGVMQFAELEFERFHPATELSGLNFGTKIDCLHAFLGKIYFMVNENEIWATDGETVELIFTVDDILSDVHALHGHLNHMPCFIEMNGTHLLFTINLLDEGLELLWKTNGTTAELVDLFSDIDWWHEKKHAIVDGKVYFVASKEPMDHDSGMFKYSLYVTNGQDVTLVYGSEDVYYIDIEATTDSKLLLFQTRGIDDEIGSLLATDGSSEGTDVITQDLSPVSPTVGHCPGSANEKYLYVERDGLDDFTLWLTDGTAEGTEPILALTVPHQNYVMFTEPFQDIVFIIFSGSNDMEGGIDLWKTDCTSSGTSLLKADMGIRWYTSFINLENEIMLIFGNKYDTTFAVSNGTIDGTKELQIPADRFHPYSPAKFMSKAYLVAEDRCPTEEEEYCEQACEEENETDVAADLHDECVDTCILQSQCQHDIVMATNGSTITVEKKGTPGDYHSFWVYDDNLVFQLGDELEGNLNLWMTDGEEYTLLFESDCIPNIDNPSDCSVYLPSILVNNKLIFLFQNHPTTITFWKSQFTLDEPAT